MCSEQVLKMLEQIKNNFKFQLLTSIWMLPKGCRNLKVQIKENHMLTTKFFGTSFHFCL